jgi:hypothetical protein
LRGRVGILQHGMAWWWAGLRSMPHSTPLQSLTLATPDNNNNNNTKKTRTSGK